MSKPKIISQLSGETSCDILLAAAPSANMDARTKTYVDTKTSTAETAANTYTDTKVANMDATTKTYVDTKTSTAETAANAYTDTKVANSAKTTGATFTGALVANGASTLTTGQARNIYCSTSEPTGTDGSVGDIWLVYA